MREAGCPQLGVADAVYVSQIGLIAGRSRIAIDIAVLMCILAVSSVIPASMFELGWM